MVEQISLSGKVPPQNIEAEQCVLGSILLDKSVLDKIVGILKPPSFYKDSHRTIFQCIVDIARRGEPVDLITLTEELRRKDKLELVGGIAYLTTLVDSIPTTLNVEYYAKIVHEKAKLRSLIFASTQIINLAYDGKDEVDKILDKSEKLIFDVHTEDRKLDIYPMKSVVEDAWKMIDAKYKTKGITGVSTGFIDIDNLTSGLQDSDLIIIAGRTSMGKTSLALNIVGNVAVRENLPVAIFSLEMAKEQLAMRMLCSEAMVNQHRLRTGYLTEEDWKRIGDAANILSSSPIFVDETTGLTSMNLRSKARRLKAETNLKLIVVDYLQLMEPDRPRENKAQEISEISKSLKALARELKIPVIALSQLSREIEKRKERIPQLSDLRESGSIEQDADVVMFIHRMYYELQIKEAMGKEVSDEEERKMKRDAKLIIAKQRNGPTANVKLYFLDDYTRFVSVEKTRTEDE